MRRLTLLLGVLATLLLAPAAGSAAPRPLQLGFAEDSFTGDPLNAPWWSRARAAGADFAALTVKWSGVAPRRPAGDATDPANPAYDFAATDATVRAAAAAGVAVTMRISYAPAWAEGADRPVTAVEGSWRPDATAFGQFAEAVARRYDGRHGLPRVRTWQAWGEVNLELYLAPQWRRTANGTIVAESPAIYRRLLNAFYSGVKAARADNVVVTGGTAPFGDAPGGRRMPPARFVRELLCLRGRVSPKPTACPNRARFDALSHHPYAVGGPTYHALNFDDVSTGDIDRLTSLLRVAERTRRVLPAGRKGMWITEFSWDSSPPDPDGVPETRRARWIAEVLHRFWRDGVSHVAWYLLRDQAAPPFNASFQSGLYTRDGKPKLGLRAFRFPFVVQGRTAWGRSPVAGRVRIQRSRNGRWSTVATVSARRGGVFTARVSVPRRTRMRAVVGARTSLVYHAKP